MDLYMAADIYTDIQKIFWRKISMVDGIIFDMDGVLVDSERQSNEGWKCAAKKQGIDMPMWLIDSFKGAPDELNRKMFDDYFDGKADYWETKKLRTEHIYKIREKEGLPVKKGVKEIFEYIKANNLKCAVATSTRRVSAEKTLSDIGVSDYLDAVVYGNEVEHGKPEPDIFLLAADAIGVKPENAIVVEDSINGIKAGHAAGMRVIHVPDTIAIDDEIRKLTYCVCNDLTEIVDIVDSINKPVINRKAVLNAFAGYVHYYDPSDGKIKLKIDHTYRVAALCEKIADSVGLTGEDKDVAWLLGMLHDIGRFEQIRCFGTFNDGMSVDHAELGADILFDPDRKDKVCVTSAQGTVYAIKNPMCEPVNVTVVKKAPRIINKFVEGYVEKNGSDLLELAIRQHNKFRIADGLSKREEMFCNILRDADKIDILKVNVDVPLETIYNATTEEIRNSVITDEVLECFYAKQTVLRSLKKSVVDNIVGHISLIFELVYPVSLKIVKEQGYVYKMLDFKSDRPDTVEKFAGMRKFVDKFLEGN